MHPLPSCFVVVITAPSALLGVLGVRLLLDGDGRLRDTCFDR